MNQESPKKLFQEWAKDFDREYSTLEEEAYRYGLWLTEMQKIIEINDQDLTFKLWMNQFGDMTDDQFKIYIHGHKGSCLQVPPLEDQLTPTNDFGITTDKEPVQAPASVDWQASGDVTPVKNQGQCGMF